MSPSTIARAPPSWSPDGRFAYVTVHERGNVRLYRLPTGGVAQPITTEPRGTVGAFSVARPDRIAFVFSGPKDLGEGRPAQRGRRPGHGATSHVPETKRQDQLATDRSHRCGVEGTHIFHKSRLRDGLNVVERD